MELIVVFLIFIAVMAVCLGLGITMIAPLTLGFFLFAGLALRRGYPLRQVLAMALQSLKESLIVVRILFLIGCLTGLWRISGTVACFVTLGVSAIPPTVFLLAAFLLTSIMSFAIGTSFGVTATAGVILISIARAGGISPILAAGAIYSGVYVGDRGSPAASSGNLVAVLTHTDMGSNVKAMLRCSWQPYLLCCLLYGGLSFLTPMETIDRTILNQLESAFTLSWPCMIPAVLMIVLPFCRVPIRGCMAVSLVSAFAVAMLVQGCSAAQCLRTLLLGYHPQNSALDTMLSGGGIRSMLEVCVILSVSGTYGGIFRGTGLLDSLTGKLTLLQRKTGRYPLMLAMSIGIACLFCNQTIGIIMQNQLCDGLYGDTEAEKTAKMLDIENTVVLTAGLVPWCIACSVPLAMLGVPSRTVLFGFYLWLVPLFCLLQRKTDTIGKTV